MQTPGKIGAYGAGLVAVFVAAWGVGTVAGPTPLAAPMSDSDHAGPGDADGQRDAGNTTAAGQDVPGGLQVAQDGYRLEPVTERFSTATQPSAFAFRVIGPDGAPVTRYTPTHDKDLHLIVVRRDLSGFQHVHPTMAADGTWAIPLAVAGAGQYRVFADFQPTGRDTALTLGVDVAAAGTYQPAALPAPAQTTTVDGYTVTLAGDLVPGTASKLTLSVSDGRPVTDLQPYLAAYGHLVALRDGDLAYLHVHPDGAPGDGRTAPGPDITFYAQVPSAGTYRLFLDFQHGGTVRTAEFTAVAGPASAAPSPATPAPSTTGDRGEPGHGHN